MYLSDRKTLMVFISGAMYLGTIYGKTVSAALYETGGWLLTGLVIPILDIILMFSLPFFGKIHQTTEKYTALTKAREPVVRDVGGQTLKCKPSKIQNVAFILPDVAVFLINSAFCALLFCLPPRIEMFSQKSISLAAIMSTLLLVFSFLASTTLAFISNLNIRTEFAMLISNFLFHMGALLAFGSTTEFLKFPFSYEIGCFFVGIGSAGVINLATISKFSLYQKWGVKLDGLAERSTAIFNFSMSMSAAVGAVLGGLIVTRESEIPAICGATAFCLINTAGFIACILIK